MKRCLILLAISLCPVRAEAESSHFPAKALFDWCISDQRSEKYLNCLLYIGGFLSGFNVGITPKDGEVSSSVLCLPSEITPPEAAHVFVREWRSVTAKMKPENLATVTDEYPQVALTFMLMRAYPCKNSN
jgi:hypothetical protein